MDGLTIVFSIASLAFAALAAYFGNRALLPQKRELSISSLPPVGLLGDVSPAPGAVEVLVDGERFDGRGQVVFLTIQNTGRFDVAPSNFGQRGVC
jgi:hypothetical protein